MTLTDDLRKAMEAVRGLSHAVLSGEKPTEPVLAETLVPDEVRRTLRSHRRTEEVLYPLPPLFVVYVTRDDGLGAVGKGDAENTCAMTYTVESLDYVELATKASPQRPRFPNVEYAEPSPASLGLAYYDTLGDLYLYEAVEEIPAVTVCP